MDVNEKDALYRKIEKDTEKFCESFDLQDAVGWAIMANFENRTMNDRLEFAEYLDFTYGNSIKVAYQKGLGKMAEVDYEILKQCKEMEKTIKSYANTKQTKKEEKFSKKIEKAKKHAEQLSEELSK